MSALSPWLALLVSAGIIGLSAFFVAIEFALVAARRYRLEQAADTSAAARAALASARDLSMLLAGSQLGITLCTLALGAVTKPAVHHLMTPVMERWGLAPTSADLIAFFGSLAVVTFLHLVIGEMAPKSWAIAHPERSAIMLAIPMRGFMWFTRPALVALNGMANWCLRRVGVQPVDEVHAGRTADDLRQLVDHSASTGALDQPRREQLTIALDLHTRPVRDVVRPARHLVSVPATATADQIRTTARDSGHLRLVVHDDHAPVGIVHVRDTLTRSPGTTAADLMRPIATLPATTPIHAALNAMREHRNHLVLVTEADHLLGHVTLQDLLDQLLAANRPTGTRPAGQSH